jgi:hypothetical protein
VIVAPPVSRVEDAAIKQNDTRTLSQANLLELREEEALSLPLSLPDLGAMEGIDCLLYTVPLRVDGDDDAKGDQREGLRDAR